jgi:hypothetical protein
MIQASTLELGRLPSGRSRSSIATRRTGLRLPGQLAGSGNTQRAHNNVAVGDNWR